MINQPDQAGLTQQLKQYAYQLGFNLVGIVPAAPSPQLHAYLKWIEQEMHGEMNYMARPDRVQRRQDLNLILPNVQYIVCVGLDYHTPPLPDSILKDPSRGRISNYAHGKDYHHVMTPRLQALADWLGSVTNSAVKQKVYVDTGAILERSHANLAGLGFTGKNTMLIHPRRGSFFFLGELLTTLPLLPEAVAPSMPSCGRCTRCIQDCPTNAIIEPYRLDARRCISYLTIENPGPISEEFRTAIGARIYGCDDCLDACPWNRFAKTSREAAFQARDSVFAKSLRDFLALSEDEFRALFAKSPIKRIKRHAFLRNVCVALGNVGTRDDLPALEGAAADPHPLVAEHAQWAISEIRARVAST